MKVKKIIIVLSVLVLIMLIGSMIYIKIAFSDWTDGTTSQIVETKKSNLGDKFVFKYETRKFPDFETSITVFDSTGNEKILHFVIEGEFDSSDLDLVTVIDSSQVRCYKVYDYLIYRVGGNKFKGAEIETTYGENEEIPSDFFEVAKALVNTGDWKWMKTYGALLIKSGAEDIKKTIERYSKGEFSQEELYKNKDIGITKEDIQLYCQKLMGH